jgi:hypothetical protein
LQRSERFEADLLELVHRDEFAQTPIIVVAGLFDVLRLMLLRTSELRHQPRDLPAALVILEQLRGQVLDSTSSAAAERSERR